MLSNAGKGSQIGFSLIVGWFVGLCIALVLVSPSSPERLLILALVWLIVGLFASLWYFSKVRLGCVLPLNLLHVPLLVRYWVCYVERPTIMKGNNSYSLKLGFTEHWFDISLPGGFDPSTPDDKKQFEKLTNDLRVLSLPEFKEEAMVESGNLLSDRRIKIVVNAPAFSFDSEEYEVNVDDLVTTPLNIPCLPKQRGSHHIAFDFYDQQGQRCGGIVVPVDVSEQVPFLAGRVTRIVQIIGGVIALVSAVLIILEKVFTLL